MKIVCTLTAFTALITASAPWIATSQVVVLSAPGATTNTTQPGFNNTNLPAVLPQALDSNHRFEQRPATQESRGIGSPSQAEPAIAPQFNEPAIGQQAPPPLQTGLPSSPQVTSPVGVQPGLSDQGVITAAPGTIIVGPQGNATVITPQGGAIGVGQQGSATAIAPNNIAPSLTPTQPVLGPSDAKPVMTPQNVSPALKPQNGVMQPRASTSPGTATAPSSGR